MGHMLHNFTDGLGHPVMVATLKAHNVPGYRPQHSRDGGECALTLHTLPVLVRYELTMDLGGEEIAEVTEVSIHGHPIPAAYFDADTLRVWAGECMASRGGL